jgi:hypothetical protein
MIIRNLNGKIEIINKYNYINDDKYYERILNIMKKFKHDSKENIQNTNTKNKLLSKI